MTTATARAWWLAFVLGCGSGGATSDTEGTSSSATGDSGASTTSPGDTEAASTETASTSGVGDTTDDTGSGTGDEGGGLPHELADLCPAGLPVDFSRPDEGDPIDPAQLSAVTGRYLELLEGLRWFDLVGERVHGWPIEDPRGRYFWGTWWSGVDIVKEGGAITFRHGDSGADNNGLRTGPLMEGVCYGHALWGRPQDEMLLRGLMRGFTAWILAMEREQDDPEGPLLSRAFYPQSIDAMQGGVPVHIDYDANHPGIDADPSEYVHVPENPWWGDVWIKNKRSKDDIGHMLRAIAQLGACRPGFASMEAEEDFSELRGIYAEWSRRVEDDGWRIATLDKDAELWFPNDLLAYFVPEAECDAILSIRLLGRGDAGELDCGNGIGAFDDAITQANDHNGNILRSFHEAATNHALLSEQHDVALLLMDGLVERMSAGLDSLEGTGPEVPWLSAHDELDMLLHAMAVGVPLTWREVAWLHARIDEAHAGYLTPGNDTNVHVFDAATPDGEYSLEVYGPAINFISLGAPLAACASPCAHPEGKPLLDCEMVRAWSP
jgi:hypothetical protein